MMVYLLVDEEGYYKDKAYTCKSYAEKNAEYLDCEIECIDLPFVGKYVYYVSTYFGYNYDFMGCCMYDVVSRSKPYSCIDHLKKGDEWIKMLEKAYEYRKNNGDSSISITGNSIVTMEMLDRPFTCGDCMDGKFNTKINKIKVCKEVIK